MKNLNKITDLPHNLHFLQILFKEVLQQMPETEAKKLIDAYKAGHTIDVKLGESMHGNTCKTAFGFGVSQGREWLPSQPTKLLAFNKRR